MTDKYVRQILRYLVGDAGPVVTANANGNFFERLQYVIEQEDAGLTTPVADIKTAVETTIPALLGTPTDTNLATDLVNIQAEVDKLGSFPNTTAYDMVEILRAMLSLAKGQEESMIATDGSNNTIVNYTKPWIAGALVGKIIQMSLDNGLGVMVDYTRTIISNTEDTITFFPGLPAAGAYCYSGEQNAAMIKTTAVLQDDATNDYTLEMVAGVGNNVPLSAAFANDVLTVTLATDGAGALLAASNTQALVATVIDALPGFTCVAIGTGGSFIASVGADTFTGGRTPVEVVVATSFYVVEPQVHQAIKGLVGAGLNKDSSNKGSISITFAAGTTGSVATHELLQITGLVRVRMIAECTVNVAGAGTIELGTESSTGSFIAATTGVDIDAGDIWFDATPAETAGNFSTVVLDKVINGEDVGYEIKTDTLTGGNIVFHYWCEPLNSTAAVVAKDGTTSL